MNMTCPSLFTLTATDLMVRDMLQLSENMSLREAAGLLFQHQVTGAPVVNARGTCVGVLSATDFVRWAKDLDQTDPGPRVTLPVTCSFLVKERGPEGQECYRCILPFGTCLLQYQKRNAEGKPTTMCSQPHDVPVDWQVVELEKLPVDAVSHYMTADPVTATPETSIHVLARRMLDAHIHRIIVVDADQRPLGIVSSTDILAVVANPTHWQDEEAL